MPSPKNSYNPVTLQENIFSPILQIFDNVLYTVCQIQEIFKAIKFFPHFDQKKQGRLTELLFTIVKHKHAIGFAMHSGQG